MTTATKDVFVPRFEFRVFGTNLRGAFERLVTEVRTKPLGLAITSETYIASRLTIDGNVKVEGETVDVKVLDRRSGVLELWKPYFSSAFPLSGADFADHVAAQLGANVDVPAKDLLTRADVMEMCADVPGLALVDVNKTREQFSIEDALAEFVDLTVAGEPVQSVAFESKDEAAVKYAVARLGLADPVNESYPAYLQRVAF
jgi:hypothetical protein